MKNFTLIVFVALATLIIPHKLSAQGNHLVFDGTNDYVSVPDDNSLDFGTGNFTIEFWMKSSTSSGFEVLFDKYDGSNGFLIYNSGGTFYVQINGTDQSYGTSFFDGSWHHVAVVVTSATVGFPPTTKHQATVYLDGTSQGTGTFSARATVDNANSLYIGEYSTGAYYYTGKMDEIRIWNTNRSSTQINDNMFVEVLGSSSNLQAYYKLNESSGSTASDETSNSNDGTLNNFSGTFWESSDQPPWTFSTTASASNWSSTASWDKGSVPDNAGVKVTINDAIIVDGNYKCDELQGYANVTINATASLDATTKVVMNSGTLTIKSDGGGNIGSLKTPSMTGAGTFKIERFVSQDAWHFISSPVTSETSWIFTGAAVYKYDEPNGDYAAVSGGVALTPGKGFDVYYPSTGDKTLTFSGTFNNGNISSPSLSYNSGQGDGYNLVGNPYSTTIDWDASSGWTKNNLNDAVYIWDGDNSQLMSYVSGSGTNGGSRYIPATQGFFVVAYASPPTLSFTNDVKVTDNVASRNSETPNHLRFKVFGKGFHSDETVFRFDNNASESFDGDYDAYKMYSFIKSDPQLYSVNDEWIEFSINSIPEITKETVLPLYLYVGNDGDYKLSCNLGWFKTKSRVLLEDRKSNQVYDMAVQQVIDFSANMADNRHRFNVHLIPNTVISDIDETLPNINSHIYSSGMNIFMNLGENSGINIFDISGKNVFSEQQMNGFNTIRLEEAGIYLVQVTNINGTETRKVMIH